MEEKQTNEAIDWGRQPKNTSCKFLPSAWFTYHSGPGKTTRGFISNPAQVQSGCWEAAEVSMASKDFYKEYSDLAEIFKSFGSGLALWQTYRTEISGSFFFPSLDLPYTFLLESPISPFTDWLCYKCMLRRKWKLSEGLPQNMYEFWFWSSSVPEMHLPLINKQIIR